MAVTVTTQNNPVATKLVVNTDTDETADTNVTGASGTIYLAEIDNTANGAVTYVKLYNTAAVTVGTTVPDLVLMVAASSSRTYAITAGIAFGTAISMAATTAGGTAGTTGPTSAVIVRLLST